MGHDETKSCATPQAEKIYYRAIAISKTDPKYPEGKIVIKGVAQRAWPNPLRPDFAIEQYTPYYLAT